MKKINKLIGLITGLVLIFSFMNCHKGKSFEDRVNYITKKIASHLDLDDKQKVELDKIKTQIMEKHKQLKAAENSNSKKDFIAMVRSDKMELDKVKIIHESKMKSKREMGDFIMVKMVEFHAILKPEQRNKLADKLEKFMKHHDEIH